MNSLSAFINEYGPPQAFIDHQDKKFAVPAFDDDVKIIHGKGLVHRSGNFTSDMLTKFQEILNRWKSESTGICAVGFFSYDIKNILFPHIQFKQPDITFPQLWFGKPSRVVEFDSIDVSPSDRAGLKTTGPQINRSDYQQVIKSIKTQLEAGNIYQVNYTIPMKYSIQSSPWDTYIAMRQNAQPENGMFLNTGKQKILSISPERLIRKMKDHIETYPIKGTRPRSDEKQQDAALREMLSHSIKDRAEHLMIVDLMRNDLGKICEFGSVDVSDLYQIHSFPSVHHMISRVYGKLKPDISETDIFAAVFPGGSITGAPKERAMTIIDHLETYSRGVYTGSLGYITSEGNMDFNIAIRTMTITDQMGVYPVGGGIVWDSVAEKEWSEAHDKCAILKPLLIKE